MYEDLEDFLARLNKRFRKYDQKKFIRYLFMGYNPFTHKWIKKAIYAAIYLFLFILLSLVTIELKFIRLILGWIGVACIFFFILEFDFAKNDKPNEH
ncbi:MAG: hypothetical protein KDD94_02155 [Calditrichaeota bacterium]|nr:hypothetical protein [Calditrichota bacterium]